MYKLDFIWFSDEQQDSKTNGKFNNCIVFCGI